MFQNKNIFGFTLVELIVVITIVGILSTIGFVSYSGYLAGARDSNRFSQLTKLSDSLQVYAATKSLPLPDDHIEITASGTVIAYQGYVGVDVLETIDYTNGGKDPKDDSYFTYYVTKDRKHLQLLAMMEEQSSIGFSSQSYSADYMERVPKVYGKKLGVLTQIETNTPVQEINGITTIDIVNTINEYTAHFGDNLGVTGTGADLAFMQNLTKTNFKILKSCKRLLENNAHFQNKDGKYVISLGGTNIKEVYCDMTTDGGGWTLVWHGLPSEARNNHTTNEKVALSGNISFVEVYAKQVHTIEYQIESTSKPAILKNNMREYFNEVTFMANTPNPGAIFHNTSGGKDVTIQNMLLGYGNSWRVFANGRNSASTDSVYTCGSYGSTNFIPLSSNDKIELRGNGSSNCYNGYARDDVVHASESGLSMYKWQETKMYIR